MKKIVFLIIFILTVAFCFPLFKGNLSSTSYTAISSESAAFVSYDSAIKSSKPSVILFYANWCTYCRKFMPKYNSLAKMYGDKFNFVKINIESSDRNKNISNKYGIRSLPTVYIVESRFKVKRPISPYSYDSVGSLKSELDRYLSKRR